MGIRGSRYENTRVAVEPRVSLKFKLLVGFVLLSLGLVGASQSSVGHIQSIDVVGADLTPVEVVRAVAQIRVGDPITNFLPATVETRLEGVGALNSIEVTRNWADRTVDIQVVEKQVRLASRSRSGFWMIASDGTVLAELQDHGEVELIEGPATDQVVGESVVGYPASLIQVIGTLETSSISADQLEVADDGTLSIQYQPLGTVVLGTPTDIENKIQAMRTVERRVDLRCLAEVDVSVAELPTVSRNQGCAERAGLIAPPEAEVADQEPETSVETAADTVPE